MCNWILLKILTINLDRACCLKKIYKSIVILKKENDKLEKLNISHFNDSYNAEIYQLIPSKLSVFLLSQLFRK